MDFDRAAKLLELYFTVEFLAVVGVDANANIDQGIEEKSVERKREAKLQKINDLNRVRREGGKGERVGVR